MPPAANVLRYALRFEHPAPTVLDPQARASSLPSHIHPTPMPRAADVVQYAMRSGPPGTTVADPQAAPSPTPHMHYTAPSPDRPCTPPLPAPPRLHSPTRSPDLLHILHSQKHAFSSPTSAQMHPNVRSFSVPNQADAFLKGYSAKLGSPEMPKCLNFPGRLRVLSLTHSGSWWWWRRAGRVRMVGPET